MSWTDVLTGAHRAGLGPSAIIYCLAADRPQHPLRLHRPAELRSGRVHDGRWLRPGYALIQDQGWPLFPSIMIGLLAAVVLALILGVPPCDFAPTISRSRRSRPRRRSGRSSGQRASRTSSVVRTVATASSTACGRSNCRPQAPEPPRRCALPRPGLPGVRLLHHDRRLVARAAAVRLRLPVDAQPVGPCPQEHPRGRGRRTQPRQERLLLQDAGARARRRHRRDGRHHERLATSNVAPSDFATDLHLVAPRIEFHARAQLQRGNLIKLSALNFAAPPSKGRRQNKRCCRASD